VKIWKCLAVWAIAAMGAVPAEAQFTTVVPPARPRADTTVAVATVAQQRDSATRETMTEMREWVDSAAATLGVRVDSTPVDTAARVAPIPPPAEPAPRPTEAFREGAPAPNTATPLPLLALSGAGLLVFGLLLLRRQRCAESSARS
jgi:hypothetical protein